MRITMDKLSLAGIAVLVGVSVTACGQHATSPAAKTTNTVKPASTQDQSAAKDFIKQENVTIQKVNQGFLAESTLIKKVTTKQLSYKSFETDYKKDEANVTTLISQLADAKAPSSAKQYQSEYVSLLNQGVKVFADQYQAILPNRTINKSKVTTIKQELNSFVKQSQSLAQKYPVQ